MPPIFNKNSSIASAVSYVTPTFDPEALKNVKSKVDLDRYILRQTQGESVLLTEAYDIPSLMYITNVIYSSSPELVLVTKDGLKVQIFDFTSDPVIRPSEIITSFSILNKEIPEGKSEQDIRINIQEIWERETSEDVLQKLYICLKNILKQSPETTKTTLIGKEPVVLFLLTQHILATRTKELWYQSDLDSKPVRIY
ncbi:MAG: hypothetical protein KatS3mg101_0163 [Patescibacteria group bacterium]|nr:MAG: hypothetical protein KatS3mg101_0163 [Patescibacteria group bacterium]